MIPAKDLLLEGELFMGDYNIAIGSWSDDQGWRRTLPPVYAVMTDHRLILQPHTHRRRDPAVIPAAYMTEVRPFDQPPSSGIVLNLKSNQCLGFFVPGFKRDDMLSNLLTISRPAAARKRKYEIVLDEERLQRLIDFVSQL